MHQFEPRDENEVYQNVRHLLRMASEEVNVLIDLHPGCRGLIPLDLINAVEHARDVLDVYVTGKARTKKQKKLEQQGRAPDDGASGNVLCTPN